MATEHTINVLEGPSRGDLHSALQVSDPSRTHLDFVTHRGTYMLSIIGLKRLDGEGNRWVIAAGHYVDEFVGGKPTGHRIPDHATAYEITYDSVKRKGTMERPKPYQKKEGEAGREPLHEEILAALRLLEMEFGWSMISLGSSHHSLVTFTFRKAREEFVPAWSEALETLDIKHGASAVDVALNELKLKRTYD